jgi:outer membrane protein OmpA-like peptidoglycan-associated protein
MNLRIAFAFAILAAVLGASPQVASARDADYERLAARFDALAADPKLGTLAPAQMDLARASLQAFKDGGRRDRPYLGYIAEHRIDIARTTAEAELADRELASLQRDNDRLQLEAARRDAALARRELERQRLQAQIRAEEAERLARDAEAARAEGEEASQAAEAARAEAAQAKRMADAQAKAAALAKKEAELAGSLSAASSSANSKAPQSASRMTLGASAFERGQSTFTPAGQARIGAVVDFIDASPGSRVHIEAGASGNRALATARAQALRDALVASGVAASRIEAMGTAAKGRSGVEIRLEAPK